MQAIAIARGTRWVAVVQTGPVVLWRSAVTYGTMPDALKEAERVANHLKGSYGGVH